MAAFDTPWTSSPMSVEAEKSSYGHRDGSSDQDGTAAKPTIAAFSPHQQTASRTLNRSSILIHQKSPLLVATPPQVTRALAYSHAFILPLNHLVGLLSWTSGDAWESFLLLAIFWFTTLYADIVLRWTGPLIIVLALMLGLFSRRYSPLSTTAWNESNKRRRENSTKQRKSLDEILDTLNEFTSRCDVLIDPFLRLTEYLSTQSSATSSTTRPALTTLFIRLLAFTPIWMALTLRPLHIITTRRVILIVGTIGLTWHSRIAHACRAILWRSRSIRRALSLITGLHFTGQSYDGSSTVLTPRAQAAAAIAAKLKSSEAGVRFTFSTFENQRRWLGLGWTSSLLPGEGSPWTDEHQNSTPEPQHYRLPEGENDATRWRWVSGSEWHVDGGGKGSESDDRWTYYDNYWRDPRRTDGFSRYTRRRKWCRDAELIGAGVSDSEDATPISSPRKNQSSTSPPKQQRTSWLLHRRQQSSISTKSNGDQADSVSIAGSGSSRSRRSHNSARDDEDSGVDDIHIPLDQVRMRKDWDRSVNESVWEGLG